MDNVAGSRIAMPVIVLSLVFTKVSPIEVSSPDYCYNENWCAPTHWYDTFSTCRPDYAGSQSPVNMDPLYMVKNMSMKPLNLEGYDSLQYYPWVLKNIRDTVALVFTPGMRVNGADLTATFETRYLSFHWGSKTKNGSEHTYNERKFPMEMQIFHARAAFSTVKEAAQSGVDNVLILAFFIDIGPEDNPVFEIISSNLSLVPNPGDTVLIQPFVLLDLLPNDISKFYRYPGSFTFPECLYGILWAVYEEPIYISQQQYDRFTSGIYYNEPGEPKKTLTENYRYVHALFERKLMASPNATIPEPASGGGLAANLWTVLMAGLASLLLAGMT